ncbi:universal stress protein [Actinocatenispora thailandica]|uniref:Universal stress protein n=1 Tax=Actinocatenispora thailandica TaxID=227318 RepID=A0A7R7DWQ2_9ACTN|nr:universal stress protein [Actinocatenispora thailandica]BCJ39283.1 universal stress protein [Actinocatenispora thailandica]
MYDSTVDNDTVVVGVDGTPNSRAALAWAARSAAGDHRNLLICHVRQDPSGDGEDAAELLTTALEAARRTVDADRIQVCLSHGDPSLALARLAAPAQLLVLGAEPDADRPGASRELVALRTAMAARCPLVVVRADGGMPGPLRGQVVAAVDGSPAARSALEFAFGYADAYDLPLAAAHVTPEPAGGYWFDERLLETHFATEPAALGFLERETEPWRRRFPRVAVKLVVLGGSRLAALTMASQGASLLAIGRAERGSPRAALGPIAYGLLRDAGCPVAVLSPAEAAQTVPAATEVGAARAG